MTESAKPKPNDSQTGPGALKRAWGWWKRVARKIGDFNARVILTIFYLVPLLPFALAVKAFTDPLEIKKKTPKGWHAKEPAEEAALLENARRQF